jgi:8-oxo-dGTP pyrophosphatase MutT (NUDIX family)
MKTGIEESEQASVESTVQRYVVGFLFSQDFREVTLIRKQKPTWLAGLLNGIGGKIEPGESSEQAMKREFFEEGTYPAPSELQWKHFCAMSGTNNAASAFSVDFFYTVGRPEWVMSREIEQIEKHETCDIAGGWEKTIGNLPWLVAMARDFGLGKCPPKFVTARY